jgi:hypothetical protein
MTDFNMDMDMSDPQPGPDRPRGYNVPMPPMLPFNLEANGVVEVEHWADVNEKYTIRLSNDHTFFETRELDDDDPTGMGKRFPEDWPKMYPMGPPSKHPDFHPLHEKYGLKILNAAGFINSVHPYETMSGPVGRLQGNLWRNPSLDWTEVIHPVLRFDMWRGITLEDYNLIRWSIYLASAILDDPQVLNYFWALKQPAADMITITDPDTNMVCKIVDIPSTLTEEQQHATYQAILATRSWVCFDLSGVCPPGEHASLGTCETAVDQNNNPPPVSKP